jgi:hypothetical protein
VAITVSITQTPPTTTSAINAWNNDTTAEWNRKTKQRKPIKNTDPAG